MAASINQVIIMGNLGADPEIKAFDDGGVVARISVATDESYKDRNTDQRVEKTEWHRITFYRRNAEIVRDYLKKGSHVHVTGKLETRKWQDTNGETRYALDIRGLRLLMLDKRGDGPAPDHDRGTTQNTGQSGAGEYGGPPPADDFDDDIPF